MTQTTVLHEVTHMVVTPYDARGKPQTHLATATGQKVACSTCGHAGWDVTEWPPLNRLHWLRHHVHHVLCSCGRVVTVNGFSSHVASSKAHGK